jgi:hypothetical protein
VDFLNYDFYYCHQGDKTLRIHKDIYRMHLPIPASRDDADGYDFILLPPSLKGTKVHEV